MNCLSPIGDALMRQGLVSFLSVIETEGPEGEDGQLDLDQADKKKGKGKKAKPPEAPPLEPGQPEAEEGVEKIKGHDYFIATVTRPPTRLPRQPVPGRGGARLRRQLAGRQADRALPLRQPGAAALPARRLRHHRGDREDRLAQLPAQPAQGLAAGGAHGAARAHRVGLGALHQRVEGGGGPLPGDPPGDPAGRAGVRPQAGRPHPQAAARRLPGPAPLHLRALHPRGGRGHRQDRGAQPRPHPAGVPAGGREGDRGRPRLAGREARGSGREDVEAPAAPEEDE